jgi:hypothetical protein
MTLTDKELIDYTIKFSDDAEKVRLATAIERVTGAIIDDLEDAGMDPTFCTFRSEWGGEYHPGRYITLLEDEIRIRDEELHQLREELEELKTTSLINFIADVKQQLTTAEFMVKEAQRSAKAESDLRKEAEQKWDMWDKLHHGIRS